MIHAFRRDLISSSLRALHADRLVLQHIYLLFEPVLVHFKAFRYPAFSQAAARRIVFSRALTPFTWRNIRIRQDIGQNSGSFFSRHGNQKHRQCKLLWVQCPVLVYISERPYLAQSLHRQPGLHHHRARLGPAHRGGIVAAYRVKSVVPPRLGRRVHDPRGPGGVVRRRREGVAGGVDVWLESPGPGTGIGSFAFLEPHQQLWDIVCEAVIHDWE
mmetsp:Transcript_28567/g.71700  ORF Transcript_28567/g.71700 Transcript_28567/m.71700 type:complete len:215 (-) Transcript_28567:771-1415(-)